jgi:hypothetical protein
MNKARKTARVQHTTSKIAAIISGYSRIPFKKKKSPDIAEAIAFKGKVEQSANDKDKIIRPNLS